MPSLSSFGREHEDREQEDRVLKPKLGTFKRFHREGKEGESEARESEHKEVREKRKYQTKGEEMDVDSLKKTRMVESVVLGQQKL
jgi:hypothetical protein